MDERAEYINDLLNNLSKTTYGLEELIRLKMDTDGLKPFLKILERKEKSLKKELEKIRKNCKHDWDYKGNGHNYDWYECSICGEMEDR